MILMNVDSEETQERIGHRTLDRFERSGAEFFSRVDDGFRSLAAAEPQRWVVIDGSGTPDDVHIRILNAVNEAMSKPR